MITEDYVSFETAKLLKEKGFDKDADNRFSPHFAYNEAGEFSGPSWDTKYPAPTLQMAMKWLREVKQLYIMLDFERPSCVEYKIYEYESETARKDLLCYNYEDSYEQACEAAIKYCIENLI